jgi:hypothetical protein
MAILLLEQALEQAEQQKTTQTKPPARRGRRARP